VAAAAVSSMSLSLWLGLSPVYKNVREVGSAPPTAACVTRTQGDTEFACSGPPEACSRDVEVVVVVVEQG